MALDARVHPVSTSINFENGLKKFAEARVSMKFVKRLVTEIIGLREKQL